MRLVRQSVSIKPQDPGISGIYKQIEWAGRHCYKSLDKINTGSEVEFVDRMIKSGHLSVLEHGTVYLKVPYGKMDDNGEFENEGTMYSYHNNHYSIVKSGNDDNWYITTNYRVLVENNWLDDLKYLCDEPTENHEVRVSVEFICSRGVWNEFIRHRVLSRTDDCNTDYDDERKYSFSQESTRYCNYSKEKFGSELVFIQPVWTYHQDDGDYGTLGDLKRKNSGHRDGTFYEFIKSLQYCELYYFRLLSEGWTPQQAREVLPNALRTELVMTGFMSDWKQFVKLRSDNSAHPQAKELSDMLVSELNKYKLL